MAMARGWDHGPGPRALLACPAGERHVFGLVTFGIGLHDAGWRITYLGADTPIAMVHYAAGALDPELIALAAVVPERFGDEVAVALSRLMPRGQPSIRVRRSGREDGRHRPWRPSASRRTVAGQ